MIPCINRRKYVFDFCNIEINNSPAHKVSDTL